MNCRSEKIQDPRPKTQDKERAGFTLMEGMAAVALLAFICTSVWLVIDRSIMSAADSAQRMRAFEIARDNMEKLLGSAVVTESTEFGESEKYPDIRWQTTIEVFDLPVETGMWARAVCSAEYSDSSGENKTVVLESWLTGLTKQQMQELMNREELKKQMLAEHILATEDLAAEYAGVSVETIRQWVTNGMPLTENGEYLKPWLGLYLQTGGHPSEDEKQSVLNEYPEIASIGQEQNDTGEEMPDESGEQIDQEQLMEDINLLGEQGI